LTITNTRPPATDLGYLLVKHPDRLHEFALSSGPAYVFFPEASEQRCTAALLLEVNPAALAGRWGRRSTPEDFTLGRYVNDRGYAASSLLASALGRVFRSALRGICADRPELPATPIPIELRIPAVRCRGGAGLVTELFAPLGFAVEATPIALDPMYPEWGDSRYLNLTLRGQTPLSTALSAVYVLLPVLDDAKHYWVSPDEIDKLLRAGDGWLATHPSRDLIVRRYLAHNKNLTATALERLVEADGGTVADSVDPTVEADAAVAEQGDDAPRTPLHKLRHQAVLAALAAANPNSVLDLGCGGGALLTELVRHRSYTRIVGVDVSTRALDIAARRLRLDREPERQRGRVTLLQSALTYRDKRLAGFDAAVLMEVIEHVDADRLPALARSVFGHARPGTVVVTTPNAEYNVRYDGLTGQRHGDHRFEWNRREFGRWCGEVAARYGYSVTQQGVGDPDPDLGAPTQLAVFTRTEATA
jgi:3' terminal RNA ribose 2'-O-methyltransferase Hen1